VKSGLIISVAAGLAVCASSVSAQVCQGDLSFRNSSKHVGGAIALGDASTSFGAGVTVGHVQGWYGGGSVGMIDYDGINSNAVAVNGGIGYSMPLVKKSKWQLCPGGTLSLGFGPNFDVGGTSVKNSSQTLTMGAAVGTAVPMSKTVNLLPFGSAAVAHTRVKANSNSLSETYLLLGAGAGIQFTPSLVFRPALHFAPGADLAEDTIFSFGLTFALPR